MHVTFSNAKDISNTPLYANNYIYFDWVTLQRVNKSSTHHHISIFRIIKVSLHVKSVQIIYYQWICNAISFRSEKHKHFACLAHGRKVPNNRTISCGSVISVTTILIHIIWKKNYIKNTLKYIWIKWELNPPLISL